MDNLPAARAAIPPLRRRALADIRGAELWHGLRAAFREATTDRVSLVAAGCAFYATLALFPAISMVVSIYGLLFNPADVAAQLASLRDLLPPSAFELISDRVHVLVTKPQNTLTFSLLISLFVALWSSAAGIKSVLGALNLAYGVPERRGFLRFQAVALGLTLGTMVAATACIGLLVLLPAVLALLGVSAAAATLARVASLAVLVGFVLAGIGMLYRFGPSTEAAPPQWLTPGSLLATILWLAVSALFSYYVAHLASYDATYGPLATVAGLMIWFYITALVILFGAELNAALDRVQ